MTLPRKAPRDLVGQVSSEGTEGLLQPASVSALTETFSAPVVALGRYTTRVLLEYGNNSTSRTSFDPSNWSHEATVGRSNVRR